MVRGLRLGSLCRLVGRACLGPVEMQGGALRRGRGFFSGVERRAIHSIRVRSEQSLHPIIEHGGIRESAQDVLILGGGVVGSALLYLLTKHTGVKRVAFLSNRREVEQRLIHHLDSTIRSGEADSDLDLRRSLWLFRRSNMLRGLVRGLPGGFGRDCMERGAKILLGLGQEENGLIEARFDEFRHFFPKIRLISGREVGRLEPRVAFLDDSLSQMRRESMCGILLQDEYTCISYDMLSGAFQRLAERISLENGSSLENYVDMAIKSIERVSSGGEVYYRVDSGSRVIYSRFLVINDVGDALRLVRDLGYCSDWLALNMVGKFQFTMDKALNGVVSTIRSPSSSSSVPICAFPVIHSQQTTRFMASSGVLPIMQPLKSLSLHGFFRQIKGKALRDRIERASIRVPSILGDQVLQGVSKMIPSLSVDQMRDSMRDVSFKHLLDVSEESCGLVFNRSRIHTDENLILNIVQPISGTTCIGTATEDMITICNKLGININERSLRKDVPEYEHIHDGSFQTDV
ncbi:putative oxidase or dehydrogenase [Cryptosporidium canis]|uniref:Oxidase or dehydrogenase n=1 Tax=Cryptosporidium canis TaxID=195482 RepID=A0ABQ8P8Y8_9CRYT|nr:putative oxidase or dehydrogenase [Cryptosporidium canis]KAJ1612846.1 putative oxidase or dehydrogenase [Cryptosporidium canis]